MLSDMLGTLVRKIVDSSSEVLRILCDLADKLSGKDDEKWLRALKRFLRKENPWREGFVGLKSLKFVDRNIRVETNSFKSEGIFGGVSTRFLNEESNNHVSIMLMELPREVPAFRGSLAKIELIEEMHDSVILANSGGLKPFSVKEFFAVIRHFVLTQRDGESGVLSTNGFYNVFYVQWSLEKATQITSVRVCWLTNNRGWGFRVDNLDDRGLSSSDCVFFLN